MYAIKQRLYVTCGPGSIVGKATVYGLDGPGIESRWGRDFLYLSRPALGSKQPPLQWVPGLSRAKAAGTWLCLLNPFYCRGHERVELYLYSPYGPYGLYRASVPVQWCTLYIKHGLFCIDLYETLNYAIFHTYRPRNVKVRVETDRQTVRSLDWKFRPSLHSSQHTHSCSTTVCKEFLHRTLRKSAEQFICWHYVTDRRIHGWTWFLYKEFTLKC